MDRPRSIEDLLGDITTWGDRIANYVAGMNSLSFAADVRTQDAVIRCLEVVGEASGQIIKAAPDYQRRHPTLALAEAYRARNRIAHGYGSVDLDTVWRSATIDCPMLVAEVRKIVF